MYFRPVAAAPPTLSRVARWVIGAAVALNVATILGVATMALNLYVYQLPAKQGTLDTYFPGTQKIVQFQYMSFNAEGQLIDWAIPTNSTFDDDGPVLTWEPSSINPDSRPLVVESPLQSIVDSNSMRIALGEVPSTMVTTSTGYLDQSLNSNVLTFEYSTHLPGSRKFIPDPRIFNLIINSTDYILEHVPSPLAGMSFYNVIGFTLSNLTGYLENVVTGPAPGTPFGSATLGGDGKVLLSQIPELGSSGIPIYGGWNAATNTPFLTNSTCISNASFIYYVTASGNTTLGGLTPWYSGDKAVCINGTWIQVHVQAVDSFMGRTGNVISQSGDYNSTMIASTVGTVADALNAQFVTAFGPSPYLPNSNSFSGDGNILISGFALSLQLKGGFPLVNNYIPYFMCNATVDQTGRLNSASSCQAIISITGTNNRVTATNVNGYVVLTTPQDTATTSAVTFGSVTTPTLFLNGKTVTSIGAGTTTIPDVGTADFVMTAGAQSVAGVKSFTDTPETRKGVGVHLYDANDQFYVEISADPAAAEDTLFYTPPKNGNPGEVLTYVSSGTTTWQAPATPTVSFLPTFYTVTPASVTGTTQTSLYGAGTGSLTIPANTLSAGKRIKARLGCTWTDAGGGAITLTVYMGATQIASAPALGNAGAARDSIYVDVLVRSVSGTTASIVTDGVATRQFNSYTQFGTSTAVSVATNVANAFSVRGQFGGTGSTFQCYLATMDYKQ